MIFTIEYELDDDVLKELKSYYAMDLKKELKSIMLEEAEIQIDKFLETGKVVQDICPRCGGIDGKHDFTCD